MILRTEQEHDQAAIREITALAFAEVEHSDQTEPLVIDRLRANGALTVSLVASSDDQLIGHIAFSPVTIDGSHDDWFGLGPVSVVPEHQCEGIGSALIREGLARLEARGAAGCVVLGDPAYYPRFGFRQRDGLRYAGAPPEYFMSMSFRNHEIPKGNVNYDPAFTG